MFLHLIWDRAFRWLLNGRRSAGAPCLSLARIQRVESGVEPAIAARSEGTLSEVLTAAGTEAGGVALYGELLRELLERHADLLSQGTVDGELLRKLSQHRDDVLRIVRGLLAKLTLQVRVSGPRTLPELILREGILQQRICLPTQRELRAEACLSGIVSE